MALAPDIVARIARRLAAHAGLEPPAWVVDARAQARIAKLGCLPEVYVELIETGRGAGELEDLVEAVRVGESRLFRHHTQIAALVDAVVPAWRAKGRRTIRVWSAGCAAGEEPYTLAAVLARAMPGAALTIVATDVSADALEVARTGEYPRDAVDDIPQDWRDAFELDGEVVRVRPDLAAMVRFERANLVDGPIGRGFDLVWCRNVLIYFTPAARKRAIDTLVTATAIGGYVFVGYSESLREVAELDAMRAGEAVYYVRREAARVTAPRITPVHGVPTDVSRKTPVPQLLRPRPPTSPGFAAPTAPSARPSKPPMDPGLAIPSPVSRETTGLGWPAVSATTGRAADSGPLGRADSRAADSGPLGRADSRAADSGPLDRADSRAADSGPLSRADRPRVRPPTDPGVLSLRGTPDVDDFTAELATRLAAGTVEALTIDLDGAEMLGDELAPVLRRASAAARSAGVALVVRATRTGPKRWLARHGLDDLGDDA